MNMDAFNDISYKDKAIYHFFHSTLSFPWISFRLVMPYQNHDAI